MSQANTIRDHAAINTRDRILIGLHIDLIFHFARVVKFCQGGVFTNKNKIQ